MSRLLFALVLSALVFGCVHRNANVNGGELVASHGVKNFFKDNPNVDTLETDGKLPGEETVRCVRQKRLGSSMVKRVCRTNREWQNLDRDSQRIWREDVMFRDMMDRG